MSIISGGGLKPEIDPWFSFLDASPEQRGHRAAFPSSLTINGGVGDGRIYIADDAGADDWAEMYGAANGNLSRVNAAPGSPTTPCLSSAGGTGEVALVSPGGAGAWRWESDTAGIWDIGSNDFVTALLYRINAASDVAFATTDLTTRDGLFHYTGGGWQRWLYVYDTGSSNISINQGTTSDYVWSLLVTAVDRSHASGAVPWLDGIIGTPVNPATLTTDVGDGGNLAILAVPGGGSEFNGDLAAAALYQAADWLDMSSTTEMDQVVRLMKARLYGHAFTKYVGSDGAPSAVSPGKALATRNYTIDGSTIAGFGTAMAVESDDGVELYIRVEIGDRFTVPAAEIPPSEWTIECWARRDGNSGINPFVSISDGTLAEAFEMGFDNSGYVYATCISAGGDNGSVLSNGANYCDNAWHKISVAAQGGRLSVKVDDLDNDVDTSSTMPASPDTFHVGTNADISDNGSFDLLYGPGYGLKVYNVALH